MDVVLQFMYTKSIGKRTFLVVAVVVIVVGRGSGIAALWSRLERENKEIEEKGSPEQDRK
jgi:hypothetical protein